MRQSLLFSWLKSAFFGAVAYCAALSLPAHAQHRWGLEFATTPAVIVGVDTLLNPWAGGFNSGAFSKMDFDADGTPDLLVWDGRAQRPLTFVARNQRWVHAPAYESAFPPADPSTLAYFALLRDYDADGLPDLFVSANQYVRLYRQERTPGVGVGFRFVRVSAPYLQTEASPQPQPLSDFQTPSWTTWDAIDVDTDGDLDLVAFVLGNTSIHLQRNQAGPGAVPVFKEDPAWGGVTWCLGLNPVHAYSFTADGTACRPTSPPPSPQHGANPASTISAPDLDGDGDHDLIIGLEYVSEVALLRNQGTPTQELFTSAGMQVPLTGAAGTGLDVRHSPATFWEDVTFDQQPDAIVSPWLVLAPIQREDLFDNRQSAALYAGGAAGLAFQQPDFLQSQMLDVGDFSAPTLGDLDGDGDLDLLVGNLGDYFAGPPGQLQPDKYRAQLRFYRNVGTPQTPIFRLADADFAGLSALDRRAIAPVLTDLDNNGTLDLVLRYAVGDVGSGTFPLSYLLNTAPVGQLAAFPPVTPTQFTFQIGANRGPRDLPCFFDVDGDGLRDILLGTQQTPPPPSTNATTVLQYWRNNGGNPATAFTLADAEFGRLSVAISDLRDFSPAVADLDGDGQPEFLSAAEDGELRVWPQLLAQPTATTPDVHNLVRNDLTNVFGPSSLGARPVLTTGDLDGDGRAEILVGQAGGGIRLLRSQPNGISGRSEALAASAARLTVFPNPVTPTGEARLTVRWTGASGAAILTLLDLLGRPVRTLTTRDGAATLDAAGLPAGMYSLRVQPSTGAALHRRIVVSAGR